MTAHAAFDKAAHFFKIKIHHVPVDPITKKVIPNLLKSYLNKNTCMVKLLFKFIHQFQALFKLNLEF